MPTGARNETFPCSPLATSVPPALSRASKDYEIGRSTRLALILLTICASLAACENHRESAPSAGSLRQDKPTHARSASEGARLRSALLSRPARISNKLSRALPDQIRRNSPSECNSVLGLIRAARRQSLFAIRSQNDTIE